MFPNSWTVMYEYVNDPVSWYRLSTSCLNQQCVQKCFVVSFHQVWSAGRVLLCWTQICRWSAFRIWTLIKQRTLPYFHIILTRHHLHRYNTHTYTQTLTLSHTHSHTHTYTQTHTHTHTHRHSHSHTHSLTHTHTHTHTLTHTHTHTHTHSHTHTHTHTLTHTHTHTLFHTHSHTHIYTHSHSLTHTHSHTLTLTHTHTHTHSITPVRNTLWERSLCSVSSFRASWCFSQDSQVIRSARRWMLIGTECLVTSSSKRPVALHTCCYSRVCSGL